MTPREQERRLAQLGALLVDSMVSSTVAPAILADLLMHAKDLGLIEEGLFGLCAVAPPAPPSDQAVARGWPE